jgi:hypothetical protein
MVNHNEMVAQAMGSCGSHGAHCSQLSQGFFFVVVVVCLFVLFCFKQWT